MAHGRESDPALPGPFVAPVQLKTEILDYSSALHSVPEAWLSDADIEAVDEADRLDRLVQDNQWVQDLALAGFTGARWDFFEDQLARYGIGVIKGWLRRGLIWEHCKAKGMGGLPQFERAFAADELEELTDETVGKALHHFRRDVLMKRKWDYRRGASLRTYFIGQCLIRFANVYRRWYGQEIRSRRALLSDDPHLNHKDPRIESVEGDAIDYVSATRALATAKDPRVRAAMIMTAAGRSQAEIATELGVTEKTVERMLSNERVWPRFS